MSSRSARADSDGPLQAASFRTGSDSPVRSDSSISRPYAEMSLASAGTRLPDSIQRMSPGTTSSAGISRTVPSRLMAARIWSSLSSARLERCAFASCHVPRQASIAITTTMITASLISPRTIEPAAAAASRSMSGLASCPIASRQRGGGGSRGRVFWPKLASRRVASSDDSPSRPLARLRSTSSKASACQGSLGRVGRRCNSAAGEGVMPIRCRSDVPGGHQRAGSHGRPAERHRPPWYGSVRPHGRRAPDGGW